MFPDEVNWVSFAIGLGGLIVLLKIGRFVWRRVRYAYQVPRLRSETLERISDLQKDLDELKTKILEAGIPIPPRMDQRIVERDSLCSGLLRMNNDMQSRQTLFWVFRNDPYLSNLSEAEVGLKLMLERLECHVVHIGTFVSLQVLRASNSQGVRRTNHLLSDSTAVQPMRSPPLTAEEIPLHEPIEVTPRSTYQEAPFGPKIPRSARKVKARLSLHHDSGSTALETFESHAFRRRRDMSNRALVGNNTYDSFDTLFTSWEQTRATLIASGVPHDELGRSYKLYLWEDIQDALQNGWDPGEEVDKHLIMFFECLGDRRFRCVAPVRHGRPGEVCSWEGAEKDRTISHICGHLGYNPYVCNGQCGRASCTQRFAERRNLDQHAKSDSVQCPKCKKIFAHKRNLKKHMDKC